MTRALRLGVATAALLVLLAGAVLLLERQPARAEALMAGEYDPPRLAPEFTLVGSDGSEVTLAEHRGKVVLLTFGFTYCAAVCPTTLATLAEVREAYGVTAVKEGTGPGYAMAHTSSIFLIDGAGRLRAMMPFGRDAADFAHDIEILLDAQG